MNKLAMALKERREYDDISREKLARILEVSTMTLARIESGRSAGPNALAKLSMYLGKTVEELRKMKGEE